MHPHIHACNDALSIDEKAICPLLATDSDAAHVDQPALQRWLDKARNTQWDYKHLVTRRGVLERLK